jgi:hypothetical protein
MSTVEISADNINLNGLTWAEILSSEQKTLSGGVSKITYDPRKITFTWHDDTNTISSVSTIDYNGLDFGPGFYFTKTEGILHTSTIDCGNFGYIEDINIESNEGSINITALNGQIVLLADGISANGNVIASSDESLKNIISNINPSVEDISKVRTVNYTFKN